MLISRQADDDSWTEATRFAVHTPFGTGLRYCAANEGVYRIYTASAGLAAEVVVWPDKVEMTAPRAALRDGE